MNYEKAYKAVLKTAQQWIKDGCTDKEKICLEFVFPELRESEDERIRKFLLRLAERCNENSIDFMGEIKKKDVLAWLEKQKEPHFTKRNALFDKCVENCDPEIMKRVSDEIDAQLEKEQKPSEWSEEDERRRDGIIQWLREYQKKFNPKYDSLSIESIESLIDWLKSLRPKPSDNWKPSEEQMEALFAACRTYKVKHDSSVNGCKDYERLASLYNDLKKLM